MSSHEEHSETPDLNETASRPQGEGETAINDPGVPLVGDGVVPPEKEREARLALANCPERAIELVEES